MQGPERAQEYPAPCRGSQQSAPASQQICVSQVSRQAPGDRGLWARPGQGCAQVCAVSQLPGLPGQKDWLHLQGEHRLQNCTRAPRPSSKARFRGGRPTHRARPAGPRGPKGQSRAEPAPLRLRGRRGRGVAPCSHLLHPNFPFVGCFPPSPCLHCHVATHTTTTRVMRHSPPSSRLTGQSPTTQTELLAAVPNHSCPTTH